MNVVEGGEGVVEHATAAQGEAVVRNTRTHSSLIGGLNEERMDSSVLAIYDEFGEHDAPSWNPI